VSPAKNAEIAAGIGTRSALPMLRGLFLELFQLCQFSLASLRILFEIRFRGLSRIAQRSANSDQDLKSKWNESGLTKHSLRGKDVI
jgi:hypothetical protein